MTQTATDIEPARKDGVSGADDARAILDRLAARRSCRAFDGSGIDRETLRAIIADGIEAPSSCNQQNWHFVVVTDPDRKREAHAISGGNDHFATCSALVYLCFQKGWTHGNFSIVQSVAGACYHMLLSAHLRGFDCIWNAGTGPADQVRAFLDLPPTFDAIGALAIGRAVPTAPAMKAPRRPVEEIFSWDRFDRPRSSLYPVKPAASYPYFEISNARNPFAQWEPSEWRWDQIADFRGYSVWAKSPLAGVYVSKRQGDAQSVEHGLLPQPLAGKVVEIMPWGGTSTTALCGHIAPGVALRVAELSDGNISFIQERLRQEGHASLDVGFDRIGGPVLPYDDSSIDTVVIPQTLEHMPEPAAMLDEVARVLRPGGHVVVSARNADSAYGALWREEESLAQVPNQGPFMPLPAKRVRDWLAARFEIEEEIGIGREATGDSERLTGDAVFGGRLYAARARRV